MLSTSFNDEPHSAVISYIVDDEFNIYFITDPTSKKGNNLEKNNKCAFVVGLGPEISTMQGAGVVEKEPEMTQEIMDKIAAHLTNLETHHWPLKRLNHESLMCYKLKPDWITWLNMDLTGAQADVYKEGFYQILP